MKIQLLNNSFSSLSLIQLLMYPFKEYLSQILEARNWNFDYYHSLILEYSPILLLTAITLFIGKFFGGRIRLKWSEFYKRKGISNFWSEFLARTNHIKFKETWRNYFSDAGNKRFFISSLKYFSILYFLHSNPYRVGMSC